MTDTPSTHVLNTSSTRVKNVIRTCTFKVLLKFSKRQKNVMLTYWTSPICNAFVVMDTSSTRVRWTRHRHVQVTSNGSLGLFKYKHICFLKLFYSTVSDQTTNIYHDERGLLHFGLMFITFCVQSCAMQNAAKCNKILNHSMLPISHILTDV